MIAHCVALQNTGISVADDTEMMADQNAAKAIRAIEHVCTDVGPLAEEQIFLAQ